MTGVGKDLGNVFLSEIEICGSGSNALRSFTKSNVERGDSIRLMSTISTPPIRADFSTAFFQEGRREGKGQMMQGRSDNVRTPGAGFSGRFAFAVPRRVEHPLDGRHSPVVAASAGTI